MNARLLPTLVALVALAFPAGALAQTSGYGDTTPLPTNSTPAPTPPPAADDAPAEEAPVEEPDAGVAAETAGGGSPTQAPAGPQVANATGNAPSTLAYTGSETWLLGLVGLLALVGGVALVRTSRTT